MNTPAPPPRVTGLLARDVPKGVLLRRGPARRVQLLAWNTETDELTPGQWLHGRISESRSHLSPDGRHFLYRAVRYSRWNKEHECPVWTAISRPPFLSALALWCHDSSYVGGGYFVDHSHVLLAGSDGRPEHADDWVARGCPYAFSAWRFDKNLWRARMVADGWVPLVAEEKTETERRLAAGHLHGGRHSFVEKRRDGVVLRADDAAGNGEPTYRLEPAHVDLTGAEWADFDRRGRIVFSREGCVWASTRRDDTWTTQLVADLSDHAFEPVPPTPAALRW